MCHGQGLGLGKRRRGVDHDGGVNNGSLDHDWSFDRFEDCSHGG